MGVRETTKNAKIAKVRLGDVCSINMGQSPDSKSYNSEARGLPFYQGNADFGDDHPTPRVWCDTPTKVAEVGEILISVRAPIGALNFANERCCIGRGLASLNPSSEIIPRYLYYSLRSKNEELNLRGTGSTFKAINKKSLATVEFFLPSLPEQKRIAEELDQICELKKNAEERLALMDRLVKSRFVEMFGDLNANSKKWETNSLGEVCDVRDGTHASPKYHDVGYPLMTSKNFANGYEDFSDVKLISEEDFLEINRRSKVDAGDIVMPMIGTIGHPVIASAERPYAIKNVALIKFRESSPCNVYVKTVLESSYFERTVAGTSRGNTQKFIALGDIRSFVLPLPPLALQREFAAFVAEVNKSKFVLRETVARMETLYKAKLQEYFG